MLPGFFRRTVAIAGPTFVFIQLQLTGSIEQLVCSASFDLKIAAELSGKRKKDVKNLSESLTLGAAANGSAAPQCAARQETKRPDFRPASSHTSTKPKLPVDRRLSNPALNHAARIPERRQTASHQYW
jgi:hypothetical protein